MFFHKQTKEVEQVEKFVRSLSITIPAKYEDEIYKLYPKGLLIKQFLNNAFVTTTIVLIVLSVVSLWYDGTMICISTIFETLLLSVVLILCCYLDISRVKADIDEINGLCEKRV